MASPAPAGAGDAHDVAVRLRIVAEHGPFVGRFGSNTLSVFWRARAGGVVLPWYILLSGCADLCSRAMWLVGRAAMGKGQGSLRRTAGIGAFVAIVMLALSLPSIAFAANTTIFRSLTPKAGSSTSVTKPKISVVCYDKYGVKRASKTSMTLDGVKVAKTFAWYGGRGHKKFKLTYKVPSARSLSLGSHRVVVRVTDRKNKRSVKAWHFHVVDRTAPSTCLLYTSDAADDLLCVDLGGRRLIKKKKQK